MLLQTRMTESSYSLQENIQNFPSTPLARLLNEVWAHLRLLIPVAIKDNFFFYHIVMLITNVLLEKMYKQKL